MCAHVETKGCDAFGKASVPMTKPGRLLIKLWVALCSPRGMPARICASYFSGMAAVMSEAMKPGATALQVMLRPEYSRAVVLVKPITPEQGSGNSSGNSSGGSASTSSSGKQAKPQASHKQPTVKGMCP